MNKALIIHHNDMDGICSGAIVFDFLRKQGSEIDIIETDYPTYIVDIDLSKLGEYDCVYILDISFPSDYMSKLVDIIGKDNIIWIDHHKTSVELLSDFQYLKGKRSKADPAACMLTYQYIYGQVSDIPEVVEYIADRDIWKFVFGNKSKDIHEWLLCLNLTADNIVWRRLLDPDTVLTDAIEIGGMIRLSKKVTLNKCIEDNGYLEIINIPGRTMPVDCFMINFSDKGAISELADIAIKEYGHSIVWIYYFKKVDGKIIRVNSLRSNKYDVSAIARNRGGGGHKSTAGFTEIMGLQSKIFEL